MPTPSTSSPAASTPLGKLLRYVVAAGLMVAGSFLIADLASAEEAKPWKKPMPDLKADLDARHLARVRDTLQKVSPGTRIDSVQFAPIDGLYEVVMGRNVAYMDASGRFALFGHIWDMQTRRDLTADRKSLLDRVDVAALDKSLALKHVRGKGTREVFVFADPQCSFCKQQEQALLSMDDVTVYTFVLPILGVESRRIADGVLCSADPAAAWSAWMLRGQRPVAAGQACKASTEGVEQLARGLGINSTPTLVALDGRKNAGAMGLTQLTSWLSLVQPVQSGQDAAITTVTSTVTPTVTTPVPASGSQAATR
jgi:thiol:disulfide interchange protein DsbC